MFFGRNRTGPKNTSVGLVLKRCSYELQPFLSITAWRCSWKHIFLNETGIVADYYYKILIKLFSKLVTLYTKRNLFYNKSTFQQTFAPQSYPSCCCCVRVSTTQIYLLMRLKQIKDINASDSCIRHKTVKDPNQRWKGTHLCDLIMLNTYV